MSRLSILELRSVRGTGGGPEKTILAGAQRRDRERFDVTVCYVRDARDEVYAIDDRARRMDVEYVELRERRSFDPGLWKALTALVRERRIDIVHAHDYKTNLLAYALSLRTPATCLATAHGWTGQTARERWVYYPADKRLLRRFPHVIAVSSEIREELTSRGARAERVTVLLNGIDGDEFRRRPGRREHIRAQQGWAAGEFVIGAVGRLERQKRFDLLLDSFAAAEPKLADARLVIAGGGSLLIPLQRRATELGIVGRVEFLGQREDVADLHHGFDMFVQSSEYEGTPNAVLEAMALETPVVATDVGGTAEIARPDVDALLVPPSDPRALTAAMMVVRRDPRAARSRAAAARQRIESDLSFDARTRRLEQIYRHLRSNCETAGAFPVSSSLP